ncbi:MAG: acyl-CoA dehydrogenase [Haliea sp.]|nr:acyl-CoA dehydrogenase [Haliea sp.]
MALDFDSARLPNPHLTESHHAWRQQLRRFIDAEIMPHADDWDEAGHIPDTLWPKAAAVGLLGLGYPEAYGGTLEGIDSWHAWIAQEELARIGAGGIPASLMVHGIGLPPVMFWGSETMKQTVAPAVLAGSKHISLGITEPDGGSDVASISTTAVRDGDSFIVNGSKTFITGGMRADWVSTAVRTGEAGAKGISMLLIPTDAEGFSRTALPRKQGWWASDTATLYFDNVRVPADQLIGPENQGFWVIMTNFNRERMAMAAGMEAMARVCLEEAVTWAQQRQTFGKRLADHQVIRHKIARMKQLINATQSNIRLCFESIEADQANPGDIALLKVQASETLEYCAREAMQILGGMGYLRGNRVERIYREVRVNAIGGGSEEIMRDLAARQYGL